MIGKIKSGHFIGLKGDIFRSKYIVNTGYIFFIDESRESFFFIAFPVSMAKEDNLYNSDGSGHSYLLKNEGSLVSSNIFRISSICSLRIDLINLNGY